MNWPYASHDPASRRLTMAAAWRLRLTEAGLSSVPEFEHWLREPGNRAAWEEVSLAWNKFDTLADAPQMQTLRQAALADARRADARPKTTRLLRAAELLAAVLLVAVLGSAGYWWFSRPDDYQTAMGERRIVTLVDGSKLSLDTNSEVTVRYSAGARRLQLLRGQARFDVAHDKKRPFSVTAGSQTVIATGTAFNIDMAGAKVLVTLIEGHVVVLNDENGMADGAGPAHGWARKIELKAGEQLSVGPAVPPEVSPANIQKVNAWTNGQIVFDDEALSSVVERVNRYGSTQIVIADPRIGAMKISGVLNAGDVPGFVEIVTHYLPVDAVSDGPNTIALQSERKKTGTL